MTQTSSLRPSELSTTLAMVTSRKFVLKLDPGEFARAVRAAAASGATFPTAPGESLDGLLNRLEPLFFDPAVAAFARTTSPPSGQDNLTASSDNLYVGVSEKDLAGFEEQFPFNSRLVKRNGTLVEEVYRIDGRYGPQIREIVRHLQAARPLASAATASSLDALIRWYRTGTAEDRRAYDIAWVQDGKSRVDTIDGFTEVLMDPRGVKGAWEGLVWYENGQKTGEIQKLARAAQWFEGRMPYDPRFLKPDVKGIVARAADVVAGTGEAGPWIPMGFNLPNDEAVKESHGSKSLNFANVVAGLNSAAALGFKTEFAWTPEEADRAQRWAAAADDLLTNMHEVLGHASGRVMQRLKGRPEDELKEYDSPLEEARAELVGLYFVADPKVVQLGLVKAEDHPHLTLAAYENSRGWPCCSSETCTRAQCSGTPTSAPGS